MVERLQAEADDANQCDEADRLEDGRQGGGHRRWCALIDVRNIWNGNTETLKPTLATISTMPTTSSRSISSDFVPPRIEVLRWFVERRD